MRRRELIGAFAAGGLGLSSGCLSTVARSTSCAPSAQFGIVIENHGFRKHTVSVTVTTPLLDRHVFTQTFDVPPATDTGGDSYVPETVYEPDVASNLRSYDVTLQYGERSFTHSWRVACEHLLVLIHGDTEPQVGVITAKLEGTMHEEERS